MLTRTQLNYVRQQIVAASLPMRLPCKLKLLRTYFEDFGLFKNFAQGPATMTELGDITSIILAGTLNLIRTKRSQ